VADNAGGCWSLQTHLGTQLLLVATFPPFQTLEQVATEAGLELQAEVLGSVCHTEQLHHAIHPAAYTSVEAAAHQHSHQRCRSDSLRLILESPKLLAAACKGSACMQISQCATGEASPVVREAR
jgi:hypothetical protein